MISKKRGLIMAILTAAIGSALYQLIHSHLLAMVAICILTLYFADVSTKLLLNAVPRELIDDRNTKAVLITGCDSGFGYCLAEKLDRLGFHVFAGCLDVHGSGPVQLKANSSDRIHLIPLDVTNDEHISKAVETVSQSLHERKLWAVVNNAGIACSCEVEWCPIEIYRRMLDVNALGTVRVTKGFLPLLRESRGRVVIVASMAGRVTMPGFTSYSMSKFAVVAFADGLRREMKKWGITVHSIEPSLYKTKIAAIETLYNSLTNYWNQCPDDIQSSYGTEYFEEFKKTMEDHMNRGKPEGKIFEVVDDLIDAVAGREPKIKYIPSLEVQFRSRLLISMPTEMQDLVLDKYTPKTPPAYIRRRSELPPLKNPYATKKPGLQRFLSVPVREKNLPEILQENNKNVFQF